MNKVHLLLVCGVALLLSGCFWREPIQEHEVGLIFDNGTALSRVVGPGRYTGDNFTSELEKVDISTVTDVWTDGSLVTSDKQVIGATVGITYRRSGSEEHIRIMNSMYQDEMYSDAELKILVDSLLSRAAKLTTSEFSLDEMLGTGTGDKDRASLANRLFEVLQPMLAQAGVLLVNVGFNDIAPSPTYLASLDAKAKANADRELSTAETFRLEQQLLQEEAQTKIALQIAQREQDIAKLRGTALDDSPALLQIEMAKLYVGAIGPNDKFYFMQPGSDLSMFFGANGALPIQSTAPITQ